MEIFIFAVLTIVNIFLQTAHSVCVVKCNKIIASCVNAVAFAVYTVVIVYTAKSLMDNPTIDTLVKTIIVFICNLFGTYFSLTVINKLKKDTLWEIVATVNCLDDLISIQKDLTLCEISYNTIILADCQGWSLHIYSYNQNQSEKIKCTLQGRAKYTVHEETVKL